MKKAHQGHSKDLSLTEKAVKLLKRANLTAERGTLSATLAIRLEAQYLKQRTANSRGGSRPKRRQVIEDILAGFLKKNPGAANDDLWKMFPESACPLEKEEGFDKSIQVYRDGEQLVEVTERNGMTMSRSLARSTFNKYVAAARKAGK